MSDQLREVLTVEHYTGGEACQYGECNDPAEYVVQATTGTKRYTFAACRDCLNYAKIYPIDNEWVDERTDQHRHA